MNDLLQKYDADTIRALLLSSHYRRPIDYSNERLDEIGRGLQAFRHLFERFERSSGRDFYTLEAPSRRDHDRGDAALPAEVVELRTQFTVAMDDDFNTGAALGALFDLVRALNRYADREKIESAESGAAARASFAAGMSVLRELTRVLGLFTRAPAHNLAAGADRLSAPLLDLLVSLRAELRQAKNFALADKIRAKLGELGVVLEDRPDGTHWKIEAN